LRSQIAKLLTLIGIGLYGACMAPTAGAQVAHMKQPILGENTTQIFRSRMDDHGLPQYRDRGRQPHDARPSTDASRLVKNVYDDPADPP
jgi:hypothetical protein